MAGSAKTFLEPYFTPERNGMPLFGPVASARSVPNTRNREPKSSSHDGGTTIICRTISIQDSVIKSYKLLIPTDFGRSMPCTDRHAMLLKPQLGASGVPFMKTNTSWATISPLIMVATSPVASAVLCLGLKSSCVSGLRSTVANAR